jgi:hypothetical protein
MPQEMPQELAQELAQEMLPPDGALGRPWGRVRSASGSAPYVSRTGPRVADRAAYGSGLRWSGFR